MTRPSRALFLYILYCKLVHMYSPTVICTALSYVYTITYHTYNTTQYYLVLLYFIIKQQALQRIEPVTSTIIAQVYQTSQ